MSKSFVKPNLNAPRYRKQLYHVCNEELYKEFLKKYPDYAKVFKTYGDFQKTISSGNAKLWQTAIDVRDGVELPEGIGFIFIGSCKNKKRENIDYGKSIKYGVKITHTNLETDGKIAKIFYTNYPVKYRIKFRNIWGFTACRKFSRTVKDVFKENWTRYISVDYISKVSIFYKDPKYVVNRTKVSDTYNEFDI